MTDDPSPQPGAGPGVGPGVGPADGGADGPVVVGAELPELLVGAARSLRHAWVRALEPHGLSPHQARALRAVARARHGDERLGDERPGDERPGDERPGDERPGDERPGGLCGAGRADRRGLRVSDLASALRIAPRSATEVADGLEERGLVVRAADPADRRVVVLRATDAGGALAREVEQVRERSGEALLARLGEADRAELGRLLRLLLADDGTGASRHDARQR